MMMENTCCCVTDNEIDGIKLHLLHLMTNTRMQSELLRRATSTHEPGGVCQGHSVTSWRSSKHIVIHRITGGRAKGYVDWPYVEP